MKKHGYWHDVYLIGSLRNPAVPVLAQTIRSAGFTVFDDWHSAGSDADDCWRDYEKARNHSYIEALNGYAAKHTFDFDCKHLRCSRSAVLALPSGRSSHLELGWMLGRGRPGFVLMDSPERWDCMYQFSTGVYADVDSLLAGLDRHLRIPAQNNGKEHIRWARM